MHRLELVFRAIVCWHIVCEHKYKSVNVHIFREPKAMCARVCLLVRPILENAAGKLTPFVKN